MAGPYPLRVAFSRLSSHASQNLGLIKPWKDFISSLTPPQHDYIKKYKSNPEDKVCPTFMFEPQQMRAYKILYDQLTPKYRAFANKTIGVPSWVDETLVTINDEPIRVDGLYNALIKEPYSVYDAQDHNESMLEMKAAAVNLVKDNKNGRNLNYMLITECQAANILISAPAPHATEAKGLKLNTNELLPVYLLSSFTKIYDLFESIECVGAFADYQSFLGIDSESTIDSKIQTPAEFVDFLIVWTKYLQYEVECINRENDLMAMILSWKLN